MKRRRLSLDLSQTQVGDAVGVGWQTISAYENGTGWPRPDTLAALCKVLKVRPWQLLAENGEGGAVPPELVEAIAVAARLCGLKVPQR